MKLSLELELEDVYGGDGIQRTETMTKTTLKRAKKEKATRQSVGVEVEDGVDQEKSEEKVEPINTFRFDDKGRPIIRLGGAHGKFWGAMKACAKQLRELGNADFGRFNSLMDMIQVSPVWTPLDVEGKVHTEGLPQMMGGMNKSMVVLYYDVIPKARTTIELVFPDEVEKKVKTLLSQIQVGSHLNKRRSIIKIAKMTAE